MLNGVTWKKVMPTQKHMWHRLWYLAKAFPWKRKRVLQPAFEGCYGSQTLKTMKGQCSSTTEENSTSTSRSDAFTANVQRHCTLPRPVSWRTSRNSSRRRTLTSQPLTSHWFGATSISDTAFYRTPVSAIEFLCSCLITDVIGIAVLLLMQCCNLQADCCCNLSLFVAAAIPLFQSFCGLGDIHAVSVSIHAGNRSLLTWSKRLSQK